MADEAKKDTQADAGADANKNADAQKGAPEKTDDKSVGELMGDDKKGTEGDKKPETVGLDKFLEIKKENKELRSSIKKLEDKFNAGASAEDVADDIETLAKEYDIDSTFLNKLDKYFQKKYEKRAGEIADEKVKPLTEKERNTLINQRFQEHFDAALEKMPEYKDIANPSVIKALSLDPKNANKTFPQLLEEAYGKAITGKRTIETTKPAGGKEPEPLDIDRARKDSEYFAEVMKDPKLKKEYNEAMFKRGI